MMCIREERTCSIEGEGERTLMCIRKERTWSGGGAGGGDTSRENTVMCIREERTRRGFRFVFVFVGLKPFRSNQTVADRPICPDYVGRRGMGDDVWKGRKGGRVDGETKIIHEGKHRGRGWTPLVKGEWRASVSPLSISSPGPVVSSHTLIG